MTETIPQNKAEFLKQLSEIHGIAIVDLTKFYEKHLNDPSLKQMFPDNTKFIEYIDNLIIGFIQEFHASVLEEFEVFVISSSAPRESKKGNLYSNHITLAKRAINNGEKPKYLGITNLEDSAILQKIPALSTGTIKVSIANETEQFVESFSKPNSEFNQRDLTWIPHTDTEKKQFLFDIIKSTEINQAKNRLSAKTEDGKRINPFSLRRITATVSARRITKKIDDETKKERETGILNLVDKSVQMNSEFFKTKTVSDPNNPGKTITHYGGFAAFCEPDDIRGIDKGSQGDFIGYITASTTMNVLTIFPSVVIAPKKPTERLQKPQDKAKLSGIDPAAL